MHSSFTKVIFLRSDHHRHVFFTQVAFIRVVTYQNFKAISFTFGQRKSLSEVFCGHEQCHDENLTRLGRTDNKFVTNI